MSIVSYLMRPKRPASPNIPENYRHPDEYDPVLRYHLGLDTPSTVALPDGGAEVLPSA